MTAFVVTGALFGWLGHLLLHPCVRLGRITLVLIGIVGAAIAGYVMDIFTAGTGREIAGTGLYSVSAAALGATALLLIAGWLCRK